jgi:hypothetical protein
LHVWLMIQRELPYREFRPASPRLAWLFYSRIEAV